MTNKKVSQQLLNLAETFIYRVVKDATDEGRELNERETNWFKDIENCIGRANFEKVCIKIMSR